jgi:DNA-binding transcriptional LysR family regulator
MNEALEAARLAVRCDSPLIQRRSAAEGAGIAELACFPGDECDDLVRPWPDERPALRTAWLVVHEDLRRAARIRVVTSAIVDAFRRQRGTLLHGERMRSKVSARR